jgi:hypothetical protein
MNKTNFISWAAVGVLWLSVGVGCQKDPPVTSVPEPRSCDDGTCCMTDKAGYSYLLKVENEPADLIADQRDQNIIASINLKNAYPSVADRPDAIYRISSALFCDLSINNLKGLSPSAEFGGPYTYKYRVWGAIYALKTITFTGQPITFFYITRIEKIL